MSGVALVAASLGTMVLGCAAVGAVGQVALVRAETAAAADLSALAVAGRLARGDPHDAACAVGARVLEPVAPGPAGPGSWRSGSRLTGCVVDGLEVTVAVVGHVDILGVRAPVMATARAGPVGG